MKHYGTKTMEIRDLTEHEDGGATYTVDMTPEEAEAMCRNGILWAIVCGCTGLTVEQAMKDYSTEEETTMRNRKFELNTLDVNKFMNIIRAVSHIIQDTGLIQSGVRFDGGVIGFTKEGDFDNDYISYNLDYGILFVNPDNLTGSQMRAAYGIASLLDLKVEERYDDA